MGRLVRTHAEISIDLDETVAGEDDSLIRSKKKTRPQSGERL